MTMSEHSPIQAVLCSKCFINQGLKLDAGRIGIEQEGVCPHCGSTDGRKLDKQLVERLAFRFFVRGTYHRATYGGAPVVQMNEDHYGKTEINTPDSLKADIALFEEGVPDSFLGTYRFDSPNLPVLYGSQDLEVGIHECRVSVEDDLYIATLRPKRDLQVLDLTEVVQDEATEFESIDVAVHMLFLAGAHSYEISREIASPQMRPV